MGYISENVKQEEEGKLCQPAFSRALRAWVGRWLTVGFNLKLQTTWEYENETSSLNWRYANQFNMLKHIKERELWIVMIGGKYNKARN